MIQSFSTKRYWIYFVLFLPALAYVQKRSLSTEWLLHPLQLQSRAPMENAHSPSSDPVRSSGSPSQTLREASTSQRTHSLDHQKTDSQTTWTQPSRSGSLYSPSAPSSSSGKPNKRGTSSGLAKTKHPKQRANNDASAPESLGKTDASGQGVEAAKWDTVVTDPEKHEKKKQQDKESYTEKQKKSKADPEKYKVANAKRQEKRRPVDQANETQRPSLLDPNSLNPEEREKGPKKVSWRLPPKGVQDKSTLLPQERNKRRRPNELQNPQPAAGQSAQVPDQLSGGRQRRRKQAKPRPSIR